MVDFHFIIAVSLFIYGLQFAVDYQEATNFQENGFQNLLWRLKFYSLKYLGEYWTRPLFSCAICMASVHTTWLYFVLFDKYSLLQLLLSILCVAGLNRIMRNFV